MRRIATIGALLCASAAARPQLPVPMGDAPGGACWLRPPALLTAGARFAVALDAAQQGVLVGAPHASTSVLLGGALLFYAPGEVAPRLFRAPDPARFDQLGHAVLLDAPHGEALAGAPLRAGTGALALFPLSGEVAGPRWLRGWPAEPGDGFGWSLALDGERLLVGAPFARVGSAFQAGRVHVFERCGGTWVRGAPLEASPPRAFEALGEAVALAGDWAALGAPRAPDGGRVLLWRRAAGVWSVAGEWVGEHPGACLGAALAMAGDRLAVGAPGEGEQGGGSPGAAPRGSVHVWRRAGPAGSCTWTAEARLTGAHRGGRFGAALAFDEAGTRLLVGAPASLARRGAQTVYAFEGGTWRLMRQEIGPLEGARLGSAVDARAAALPGLPAVRVTGSQAPGLSRSAARVPGSSRER